MRVRTFVRCSASFAAFAGFAAPALAQDGPAASATLEASAQPDGTAAAQPEPVPEEEGEMIVTGIRESLRSQQNIRRNSDQIVDAIVAADIGKLPDIAVSDTAARIPGVQVDRGGGEASRVLVRGLPDFATTYNGREIFTAETRVVALQDFPSGLIGAIEVYKTSSANLIEPGLAGLVNVRSRRPFDFGPGLEVTGSVWGLYTVQSDSVTPNGNLTISNRWDVGDGGEIGALVGFSYTQLRYLDGIPSNTDFVAGGGPAGTRFPDVQRLRYNEGDRDRPSVNGAIQWRPNPDLEIYVEGLWQGFRNRISDREITVPLWGGAGFTNFATVEGRPDLLQSATVTNPFRPDGFQGGTFNKTDTYQYAIGGRYDAGPLQITADIARTESTFTGSTASVDFAFANPQTVIFDTGYGTKDGPAFDFLNFDPANPANYIFRGLYEQAQQARGGDWQGRLDFNYDTGITWLPQLSAGIRYTDRDVHREFGDRYFGNDPILNQRIPISAVPLDYQLFDGDGVRRGDPRTNFSSWLAPTYESIRANIAQLRQFVIARGAGNFTTDVVAPDPLQTFDANERSTAAYIQARFEIPIGAEGVFDGTVGVRYAKSDLTLLGTQLVLPAGGGAATFVPVDVEREFEDFLPSINTRLRLNQQLQFRASFTQTRTKPNFFDLRASGTLSPPPGCLTQNPIPPNCFQEASGGNPYLEPLTSDNYDAAAEYYFARNGFVAVSVFHRDMEGFIQNATFEGVTDEGIPLRLNGPVNLGTGRIRGFEVQASTFFDFIGLPQVGIQGNVTHLDASADFGGGNEQDLLGVSDWAYNVIAIYESNGLSARLAYNWRSGTLLTFQNRGDHIYTENSDPIGRADLSVSYDVLPNLTVFGDWTNILNEPFTTTLTRADVGGPTPNFVATYPRERRIEESTVSLGLRFRF